MVAREKTATVAFRLRPESRLVLEATAAKYGLLLSHYLQRIVERELRAEVGSLVPAESPDAQAPR